MQRPYVELPTVLQFDKPHGPARRSVGDASPPRSSFFRAFNPDGYIPPTSIGPDATDQQRSSPNNACHSKSPTPRHGETFGESRLPVALHRPTLHRSGSAVQANEATDILAKVGPENCNVSHSSAPLIVIRQFHCAEGAAGHSIITNDPIRYVSGPTLNACAKGNCCISVTCYRKNRAGKSFA